MGTIFLVIAPPTVAWCSKPYHVVSLHEASSSITTDLFSAVLVQEEDRAVLAGDELHGFLHDLGHHHLKLRGVFKQLAGQVKEDLMPQQNIKTKQM